MLLIDRNNYHSFQPLMDQVATGGLEPGSIAHPVRRIFRKYKNVGFPMIAVVKVAIEKNRISTSMGKIDFGYH